MIKRKFNTIDGFVSRRTSNQEKANLQIKSPAGRKVQKISNQRHQDVINRRSKIMANKQSLIQHQTQFHINQPSSEKAPTINRTRDRRRRAVAKNIVLNKEPDKKRSSLIKKVITWILLIALAFGMISIGNLILRAANTANSVFRGNVLGIFNKVELKKDSYNRSNFLVFGTSEDDNGHEGGLLTDSIMVISFDHDDNNIAMISLPRDLWVKLDERCFVGNYSKLNSVYQCASDMGKYESAGAQALQKKASQVTGLDVQYYAHVNWTVLRGLVNAVGGIKVMIESQDPRGIYDVNTGVKYPNGLTNNLNGDEALKLAMARGANGGYGLPNSNFDREKNQQKIVMALIKKTLNNETLLNFDRINKILSTVGKNLRTNIKTEEIQSAIDLAKKLPKDFDFAKMTSIGFLSDEKRIAKNQNISGQAALVSVDGVDDFTSTHRYIAQKLNKIEEIEANTTVTVLNAGSRVGVATQLAERIRGQGFIVNNVGNYEGDFNQEKGIVYQKTDKIVASKILKKELKLSINNTQADFLSKYQTDFIVIINDGFDLNE